MNKGKIIDEDQMHNLCESVKEILFEEGNIQWVPAPVIICGDIHGQFYDLKELFRIGGPLPQSKYVFLGDYVDRGYNSVETLSLLLCYKLKYSGCITLLRGNHESRQVTVMYGFYIEILKKQGNCNVWKQCTELFDFMNLGALVDGRILCIHGGLSPQLSTIDQMRVLDRKVEIPQAGPFCDIMWSDPEDGSIETWSKSPRGAGYNFGWKAVKHFNAMNNTDLIARAHQLAMDGFKFMFPQHSLVTVWSAPNQCQRCGNVASIMIVNEQGKKTFRKFQTTKETEQKSINQNNVVPYFL